MLYTPPDLDGSPGSPETDSNRDDADAQFAFDPLVGGCHGGSQSKDASLERKSGSLQLRETSHAPAVVEVAKQVVEIKRLEASTAVELERLKQSGATERTRLLEEGRTQRSACVAAVMKRVMEEHHQTERQKIESTAQVQQAAIAAGVSEAEAQANTPPRPMSHWLLLWLCLGQSRRVRKVGFPVLRVAGFLLVLRGIWSSGSKARRSHCYSERGGRSVRLFSSSCGISYSRYSSQGKIGSRSYQSCRVWQVQAVRSVQPQVIVIISTHFTRSWKTWVSQATWRTSCILAMMERHFVT